MTIHIMELYNAEKCAVIIFISILLIYNPVSSDYLQTTSTKTIIDSGGIVHDIEPKIENNTIIVETTNPNNWDNKIAGYNIRVDGYPVQKVDFRLDQNESRTKKINITPGINVNQDNHTVTFSTYGNSTQFNFTREINSSNSGEVPTPHISNVEVANGTAKGEPSAVANVTLVNPSEQIYSTKLMVHTVGTDGSLYPASVRPGDTRTISVELLDERGTEIAGEARLYSGNMTTREGAIDQVEFAGRAGSETSVWDTSYEPVRPTWMDDHYEYENASYERGLGEKLSRGHEIRGIPLAYPVVAFLVGLVAVRKLR